MSLTILVTGGDGQLASCLKKCVFSSRNKWIFLSRKELDITNIENVDSVFEQYEPDVILNCAAYTNVDKAPEDKELAYAINAAGPLYLAICARYYDAKVIHISTDFVFGGLKNTPCKETDETYPLSEYGLSKLMGENNILKYDNTSVIRTSWLYSEYGNNFFKTMIKRIKNNQKSCVVNDQVGTPTYAVDLARFLFDIIENKLDKIENKIYHYSNEGCCSWYDFAKCIEICLHNRTKDLLIANNLIMPISTEDYEKMINKKLEIRPSYSVLSKSEIDNLLDFPIRHWFLALIECVDNYLIKESFGCLDE